MTDYSNCPKCGKLMAVPNFYVPAVTWNNKPVCINCTIEIQKEVNREIERYKEEQEKKPSK